MNAEFLWIEVICPALSPSGYIEGIATALPTNENGVTYIPPIVQQIGENYVDGSVEA